MESGRFPEKSPKSPYSGAMVLPKHKKPPAGASQLGASAHLFLHILNDAFCNPGLLRTLRAP